MSRKMKDSGIEWIGEIPKEWEVVPFRSCVKERVEKNKGEKTRELLALSFALGVTLYKDKVFNMDRVKENYEDYQMVYQNDLVLSPNDIIKGSAFVSKYYGCISPMYYVFSVRDNSTHHLPYLSYLLRTKEAGRLFFFIARGLIGEILDNGKYVTRRKTVSRQDLLSFNVLLPSFLEQQKIADYLDKVCGEVDELVSLQEQMIEELKAYKQSVITEAVTKGLNQNVPMKDSGVDWIGEVPEGWKVSRLKYYSNFINGFAFNSDVFSLEIGCKVIRIGDISQSLDFDGCVRANIKTDTLQSYRIKNNDIIIAMSGATTGKCCIAKDVEEAYINQRVGIIRCDNYSYVYYSLQTDYFMEYINLNNAGSAQPNVSGTSIGNFPLLVPSLDEQQSIASYLDTKCAEIDALIALKQAKIEELKEYKKSVIYEYVTGKKEVV